MLRRAILAIGLLAVWGSVESRIFAGESPAPEARVAIYDDAGTGRDAMKGLLAALEKAPTIEVFRVKASEIRRKKLAGVDVVIFPGGMSTTQGKTLGEDGREDVRDFIAKGGGYLGFCAGAYLASSDPDYDWSLNILNAKVVDKEHWARGTGRVDLCVNPAARTALKIPGERLNLYYHQGPLLAAMDRTDLPAYESWAGFETEIARNGAPSGVMPGTTAIAAGRFGQGRVLCFSPHPEMTEGLHEIVYQAILWADAKQN